MQSVLAKTLVAISFLSTPFHHLPASFFEDQKKAKMIQDLEIIKHHFEAGYAPAQWKKEHSGWDLDEAFDQSKSRILKIPSITTKQFQLIVRDFLKTMKDYHVGALFFSTESASLPFTVRGAEGRYFIDSIDSNRLPCSHYPIQVGDEILEFDERPIADVIEELKLICGRSSVSKTDQALAEQNLTQRSGYEGDVVPKGGIMVKTRSAVRGTTSSYQLSWTYHPEHVTNALDFPPASDFASCRAKSPKPKKTFDFSKSKIKMINPCHEAHIRKGINRCGGCGADISFVPTLGELLWKYENSEGDNAPIKWHAYIYRHSNGSSIGYIRIPHYVAKLAQAQEFGQILNLMEESTDALVIDQVNNPGGHVLFLYKLASMLANTPLKTPHHSIKITQRHVLEAYTWLQEYKWIDFMLAGNLEERPQEVIEETFSDYESDNYQRMMFLKSYFELILDEWQHGHTLTRPTPILGMDRINPHPKYRYTKPILMLIDELDFSSADFMPAILQDNQRALLFGSATAGAGGIVVSFAFPNTRGIKKCSYTTTLAERPNLSKIENLGVRPDIEYELTVEDLQGGYRNYAAAVNQALAQLLIDTEDPVSEEVDPPDQAAEYPE